MTQLPKNMKKTIFLLLILICTKYSFAQYKLNIMVKDSISKNPISHASLTVNQKKYLTNDFGEATVWLDSTKRVLVQITCIGYKSNQLLLEKGTSSVVFYLSPGTTSLNEVNIKSFTDNALADLLIASFKRSRDLSKSSSGKLTTYAIENATKIIEYANSAVNVPFVGKQLNPIDVKCGEISFDFNDLSSAFKSEAITRMFYYTNPFSKPDKRYFIMPFVAKNKIDFLSYHTLGYQWLSGNLLKIIFKSKYDNCEGAAIINPANSALMQINLSWLFNNKYPLITEGVGKFEGMMKVETTLMFDEGQFQHQVLKTNLQYNNGTQTDSIKISSFLTLNNEPLYNLPIYAISFASDYNTLLSRPINKMMSAALLSQKSVAMDSLIKENPNLENAGDYLIADENQTSTHHKLLVQQLTSVDFWDYNWQLDWNKVNEVTLKKRDHIDVGIFADYFVKNDSVEFTIEPLFNYNATYFSGERNLQSKEYISIYFHLTKIKADELKAYFTKYHKQGIDYKTFKSIVVKFDNELKKDIFKYSLQVNGGANQESMEKWREYITNKIK